MDPFVIFVNADGTVTSSSTTEMQITHKEQSAHSDWSKLCKYSQMGTSRYDLNHVQQDVSFSTIDHEINAVPEITVFPPAITTVPVELFGVQARPSESCNFTNVLNQLQFPSTASGTIDQNDQPLDLRTYYTEPISPLPKPVTMVTIKKTSDTSSNKIKKPSKKTYADSSLDTALGKIRDTAMPLYTAAKKFGVPRTTLQYRLSAQYKNKGSRGPYTIFSANEEAYIVKWLKDMSRKGYPITQNSLRFKISSFLKANPRPTPFTNNIPGKSWFKLFMKRHPDLSLRTPEAVTAASSKVTEKDIRHWFQNVYSYLMDNNLTDVLLDPARVLNGDETGFSLNPVPKQVIAAKGKKDISFIESTNSKQNITVMFSFAANGHVLPPDVIINQKRPSREVLRAFPGSWGIGCSENGWMDTANFALYVKKILYPALKSAGTTFPVLYFVDGHSSHTAFEAADACEALGIIMIALFPNATRILQPADVAIFKPLKNSWGKIVDAWRADHPSEKLTLVTFGPLLEEAMNSAFKDNTIKNGFRVCGLYPFDANAVDYTKCLGRSTTDDICEDTTATMDLQTAPTNEEMTPDTGRCIPVPESSMEMAIEMIGPSKINLYRVGDSGCLSPEDRALCFIYENILRLREPYVECTVDIHQENIHNESIPEPEKVFEEFGDPFEFNDLENNVFGDGTRTDSTAQKNQNLEDVTTPLCDLTNLLAAPTVEDFFVSPPTPKRNPKHRHYAHRTNAILTASERLAELEVLETKKQEEKELKKKRLEIREMRKKEKEKQTEEKKARQLERKQLRELLVQQKTEKAQKRKQDKDKKDEEKLSKKQKKQKLLM